MRFWASVGGSGVGNNSLVEKESDSIKLQDIQEANITVCIKSENSLHNQTMLNAP